MKKAGRSRPENFPLRMVWSRELRRTCEQPAVREAVEDLSVKWLERADFIHDETAESDPQLAREELALSIFTFKVKIFNPYWLAENFDALDLAYLQLAVCRELAPDREWEIVETDDHSVVADTDRTLVADLKLEGRLSAAAALLFAGDDEMAGLLGVAQELSQFLEDRNLAQAEALAKMEKLLATRESSADVTPLRPKDR